jgi:uncharacterized protein DUF4258
VRLSRHAKNEMRLYGLTVGDVEAAVRNPVRQGRDERGNARLVGETMDGRPILVLLAGDDPDFVITVFPRE